MRVYFALTLLLYACLCNANPSLILSPAVRIDTELPAQIAHTDRLLIYKFANWHFSHERLDAAHIYPGIDLSGTDREFLHALFDSTRRQALPKWLGVLAEEQANSFGILKDNSTVIHRGDLEILTSYNTAEKRGEIFIFTAADIHRLSMKGEKEHFIKLTESIKERANGFKPD